MGYRRMKDKMKDLWVFYGLGVVDGVDGFDDGRCYFVYKGDFCGC